MPLRQNSIFLTVDFRPICAESTKIRGLLSFQIGDPGMTRTCDLRFRKPSLYPAELRDRAHRRGTPTDCGFLAGPGFARHPLQQG
jgi:hypothetical protein